MRVSGRPDIELLLFDFSCLSASCFVATLRCGFAYGRLGRVFLPAFCASFVGGSLFFGVL